MAVAVPQMQHLALSDFSGGLNLRDSPNELSLNETPAATNWTLDSRGALKLRGGCANVVALPGDTLTNAYIFYSAVFDIWCCARKNGASNTTLYTRPGDLSGSWTNRGNLAITNPSTTEVAFCEFPGTTPLLVITAASPGNAGAITSTYNHATTTLSLASAVVGGTGCGLWQNRAWVWGYPTNDANGNRATVFGSKAGDPTIWTAPDGLANSIRDLDAGGLTGGGVAGGALILFKKRSAYRLIDSNTAEYRTIDSSAGCVGSRALASVGGRLYTWGQDDIYEWDGISNGKSRADKLQPLFFRTVQTIEPAGVSMICAGVLSGGSIVFAYPNGPFSNNNSLLEFDPAHGWCMTHALSGSAQNEISSFGVQQGPLVGQAGNLYGAVIDGDDLMTIFGAPAGKDDATNMTSSYKTPWLQPGGGKTARILEARIEGLTEFNKTNTFNVVVGYGWAPDTPLTTYALATPLRDLTAVQEQLTVLFRSLQHARAYQFDFQTSGGVGATSMRALLLDFVPLEF